MRSFNFSLKTTLFAIIGFLNFFIAILVGFNLYNSWVEHRSAVVLSDGLRISNLLYDTEKFLSSERGSAVSVLYAPPNVSGNMMQELLWSRKNANAALTEALSELDQNQRRDLDAPLAAVRESHERLQELRKNLDTSLMLHTASMLNVSKDELSLPDKFFEADTDLIMKIDSLINIYNRPILVLNAAAARQMRFTHLIWGITEYAGREYALLGKLIAENKRLGPSDQEQLMNWRGRIQYGWELVHASVLTNSWGKKVTPSMDDAESRYFTTFDKMKDIFYSTKPTAKGAVYPVTIEAWLDMASQAVSSLHGMNDAVLKVNAEYINDLRHDAEEAIVTSILLFILVLILSFYSWRMIDRRVVQPVNFMADTLLSATRGEKIELPDIRNYEDEIGKLMSSLIAFQENSRQLQIERDNAKEANLAKGEFLANMSHEIRTPMNVVIGISNILARSSPLSEKQADFIKTLQLSAESLLAIINDLLDISKIETDNYQLETISFSVAALVEDVITIMSVKAKEKGLALKVDLAGVQDRNFLGDPTRIRQILTNLCGNAIKFTEKGSVTLKVQCFENVSTNMQDLYISIEDTGIGIENDKLGKIFDKFTQADSSINRKYGGTGLGLSITKTLVELMGGTISVESFHGNGTSFTVYLPLKIDADFVAVPAPSLLANPLDNAGPGSNDNACVLLVEDYQPNALVAGLYLEQFGFTHEVAENGIAALRKIKQKDYHAVLMDVQMYGLDGYQTTQEIRKFEKETHKKRMRIIGMTAHALPGDREKCLDAGMDDYLSKPFNPEDLREKLTGSKK